MRSILGPLVKDITTPLETKNMTKNYVPIKTPIGKKVNMMKMNIAFEKILTKKF
jgi:hypothetical protein